VVAKDINEGTASGVRTALICSSFADPIMWAPEEQKSTAHAPGAMWGQTVSTSRIVAVRLTSKTRSAVAIDPETPAQWINAPTARPRSAATKVSP
jgi:hypothetical protein